MTMSKKNIATSLASLRKLEDQVLPVVMTPEMVASMPIETVEEELREMGLAPNQALPTLVGHIIDNGKGKSLKRMIFYRYIGNKFYKQLWHMILEPSFSKCLSADTSLGKVIAGILTFPSRLSLKVYAGLMIILAFGLFYINLTSDNVTKSYRDGPNQYQSVQRTQIGSDDRTQIDKLLSSKDI